MLNSYRVDVWSGTGIWVERVTMRLVTEGEAKRVLRIIAKGRTVRLVRINAGKVIYYQPVEGGR